MSAVSVDHTAWPSQSAPDGETDDDGATWYAIGHPGTPGGLGRRSARKSSAGSGGARRAHGSASACALGPSTPPTPRHIGHPRSGDVSSGMRIRTVLGTGLLATAAASATTVRWGRATRATLDEHRRKLPGDDLVVDPMWQLTRAISIDATPDEIWPWLVQMGHPARRAGWYAPYWFDRVFWGIRERSSDKVMPELQALSASDRVPDSRDGSAYFTVDAINPGRDLVLFSTTHPLPVYTDVRFSWVFVLEDLGQRTRLVVRARIACRPVVPAVIARPVFGALLGIGDFIEAGAMLRGIKRRAEASSAPRR